MATLYRIRDWATTYETHETRKLDRLRWVPIPNKHDGLSFKKIAGEKDGAEIFAAWILILQIASKCPIRGQLSTDDKGKIPLTPGDMGLKTGYPGKLFERALSILIKPEIGWIYTENSESALNPGESGLNAVDMGLNPAVLNGREGIEGKRREPAADFVSLIPNTLNTQEFIDTWVLWVKDRKDRKKPITENAAKLQFGKCEKWGVNYSIVVIKNAIEKGWQGLYEPSESKTGKTDIAPIARPTPKKPEPLPAQPNDAAALAVAAAKVKADFDALRTKSKQAQPETEADVVELARQKYATQDGVYEFLTKILHFELADLSKLSETYDLEYIAEKVNLVKKRLPTLPNPAVYFTQALELNFKDMEVAGETELDRQKKEMARIDKETVAKIEKLLAAGGKINQAEFQRLSPDRRNELEYDEAHFLKTKQWVYSDPQANVSRQT